MRSFIVTGVCAAFIDIAAELYILAHWETHFRDGRIGQGWLIAWSVATFPLQNVMNVHNDMPALMYVNAAVWGVGAGMIVALKNVWKQRWAGRVP